MTTRTNISTRMCTAAAVLALAGSAWGQCSNQKLQANDRQANDDFGWAVSMCPQLSTNIPMMAIGAPTDDTPAAQGAGTVYTFGRVNGIWGQLSHIDCPDANTNHNFGLSVSIADPYIIVGAPNGGTNNGAYIYERFGSSWTFKTKATANIDNDAGRAVAITSDNGGYALVGMPLHDVDVSPNSGVSDPAAGIVQLLKRQANGSWSVAYQWPARYDIYAGTYTGQHFGAAVAIKANIAVCGCPYGESVNWPTDHGFVHVYRRDPANDTWALDEWLVSNNAEQDDHYGAAVATDGSYIAIGAPDDDATPQQVGTAKLNSGCVYMQRYSAGTWYIDGQLFASDASDNAQFGSAVAMGADAFGRPTVLIGAAGAKKAYLFARIGNGNWKQVAAYADPDGSAAGGFGSAVAMSVDTIGIGDRFDDDGATLNTGAAYAFLEPGAGTGADSCGAATPVQAGQYAGCTTIATPDTTPSCGASSGGAGPDVWYSWTPNCTGNVIVDTFGSDYDTILSIHSACPDGQGTHEIACNDDGFTAPERDSLVTFDYTAGTQYLIHISGYNGASGNYVLRVVDYQNPSNDNCSSATRAYNGPNGLRTCKATIDGPLDLTGCTNANNQGADVWYRYTSTSTGTVAVDTCGSNFDTILEVFGAACPTLNAQAIACNDDSNVCASSHLLSAVTFNAVAGTTYTIRVGGYEAPLSSVPATGEGFVNVTPACPCDYNGNGLSISDIFDFLNAWFAGNQAANFNGGAIAVQDIFDFLSCWFAGCQ